jgi:hypothetical protein
MNQRQPQLELPGKPFKTLLLAASLVALFSTSTFAQTDKEIVVAGMKGLFITCDASVIDKYWSPIYVQHNPAVYNGSDVLKGWVGSLPPDFKYEPGMEVHQPGPLRVRASAAYQSMQAGLAMASRFTTFSSGWPSSSFFTGSSCFLPDSVRGISAT